VESCVVGVGMVDSNFPSLVHTIAVHTIAVHAVAVRVVADLFLQALPAGKEGNSLKEVGLVYW